MKGAKSAIYDYLVGDKLCLKVTWLWVCDPSVVVSTLPPSSNTSASTRDASTSTVHVA